MLPFSHSLRSLLTPLRLHQEVPHHENFHIPEFRNWRGALLLANRTWIRTRNTLACSCIRHGGWVLLVVQKYPEFGSPCKENGRHLSQSSNMCRIHVRVEDNQVLRTAWRVTASKFNLPTNPSYLARYVSRSYYSTAKEFNY